MIQNMFKSLFEFDFKTNSCTANLNDNESSELINKMLVSLVTKSASRVMSSLGRDTILQLISANLSSSASIFGQKILSSNSLFYLLEVASEMIDIKYESNMNISRNTRNLTAIALERIYACMDHDKARQRYRDEVMAYIQDKLRTPDIESKIRAVSVITTLLLGPIDVGNHCLSQQGIIEMILVMAGSENDEVQQRVAVEAIICATSKKEKCTSIAQMGGKILKKLYQSPNENIKVRALVGLCKLGSVGGTDASFRPFPDGALNKLTSACKKFLTQFNDNHDLKKWAAEGLAYLTLDADVKEDIAEDKKTLAALIDLAKSGDLSVLYGVLTTLVNLTNSYDKQEILPEMIELAKFSKQHIPEDHPKDEKKYIDKRCKILAENGVTHALVALSKTESDTSKELIGRIFNAICEQQPLRGLVVQQGGVKVLLNLAASCKNLKGRNSAAQALARIGITINPEVAFSGERAAEVVRPLMSLLDIDCTALANFESLMALTNLAQVNSAIQDKILESGGFSKIEHYQYDGHTLLKRAAMQCVANLITNPQIVNIFEGQNDRVKYLLLSSEDEDLDTALAASGGLAMLTSLSSVCSEKIIQVKDWLEILIHLCSSSNLEIVNRGIFIVRNIISASKECAEKIIETHLFEILVAITRPEVDDISENIKSVAKEALSAAQEYQIIAPVNNE